MVIRNKGERNFVTASGVIPPGQSLEVSHSEAISLAQAYPKDIEVMVPAGTPVEEVSEVPAGAPVIESVTEEAPAPVESVTVEAPAPVQAPATKKKNVRGK